MDGINWLAVLVAAVAHQILGALWYGPLFSKTWMAAMGKTKEDFADAGPGPEMAIAAVCSLVAAAALGCLLSLPDSVNLAKGVAYGLVAGIGFVATAVVTNAVFEEKKWTLTGLYVAYQVLGFAIMGAILGAWR